MSVPVLVITGPVGVGKTTVALEASSLLEQADVPHAVVDMDALGWQYPRPTTDPFNSAMMFRNLAALWANFAATGTPRLLLALVVEAEEELDAYRRAVPGAAITLVRLRASVTTLQERVCARELGLGLAWSLNRAAELAAQMELANLGDHVVETDGREVADIASQVLKCAGWLP